VEEEARLVNGNGRTTGQIWQARQAAKTTKPVSGIDGAPYAALPNRMKIQIKSSSSGGLTATGGSSRHDGADVA
jgi:hypothetical protein